MNDTIPKSNSFLSLQQIVQSLMNEKDEKSLTHFEKYLQLAIEVYSQMNIFEMNTINTARLDLDTNTMTAKLPADFITLIKLGIVINGKLHTLTVNNDLIQPEQSTICDAEITTNVNSSSITGGFWFSPYFWNGQYYPPLYGVSGGFNCAYYKIDYSTHTIIFSGFTGGYPILLEYKSSGVTATGGLIPREASEAMKAGIYYYSIRNNIKYTLSERQEAERRYNIELYSLQRLNNSFSYDEICDTLYACYRQGPKR